MNTVVENVINHGQILYTRISNWKNKVDFKLQVGPYFLQVAEDKKQLLECFKLRHEVFCLEMAGNRKKSGLDFDQFDSICDHLIIFHEPSQRIVGTYRLNLSGKDSILYTNSEFHLQDWMINQKEAFVELGRACIQSEHRRGIVITLLWRGIAEYMKMMNVKKLLGCSSVKVTDPRSAALVYRFFEDHDYLADEVFMPRKKYQMPDYGFWLDMFRQDLSEQQNEEAKELIPSLLNSYLKIGAKVASHPAYDEEFNCIDFVTILDQDEMNPIILKKFLG